MKFFILLVIVFSLSLFASNNKEKKTEKQIRTEQNIQKALEKEQKYSREKIFYTTDEYDFKDAEVNQDSLPSLNEQKVDSLDMDSVYD